MYNELDRILEGRFTALDFNAAPFSRRDCGKPLRQRLSFSWLRFGQGIFRIEVRELLFM
jgi:hypothetical protein